MSATESASDRLIAHYLREVRVSAWIRQLPRSQTDALEARARTDIQTALAEAGNRDEATVYGVLDRLGEPGDFVASATAPPRSGLQRSIDTALGPLLRLRDGLRSRGWGAAEIGALLLLIAGPFYLWWVGPMFGMALAYARADRWTDRALRRAAIFAVALFAAQMLVAFGMFAFAVVDSGTLVNQLAGIFDWRRGVSFGGNGPLLTGLLLISPAFIAGIGSGLYLAFSPRDRR